MPHYRIITLLWCILFGCLSTVNGQNLGLDSTFNNSGVIIIDSTDQSMGSVRLRFTSDSCILNCSYFSATGFGDIMLNKFNRDGSPDTSFGQGGTAVWGSSTEIELANNLHVFPDDKILVVGWSGTGTYSNALVAKFNADGSIDSSFGNAGVVTQSFPGWGVRANCAGIQSDGKILVAGGSTYPNNTTAILFRLLPNGQLDSSFGTQGTKTYYHYLGMQFSCMHPLSNNRWLLGGYSYDNGMLFKLAENGDPDTLGLGPAVSNYQYLNLSAEIVSEIIKLGNNFYLSGFNNVYAVIFSLTENFQINTSFGTNGATNLYAIGASRYRGIAFTPDSSIIAVGRGVNPINSYPSLLVSKYLLNGTLDTSFHMVGYSITLPAFAVKPEATSVLIQNDGKIITGGYTSFQGHSDVFILRMLNKLKKYNSSSASLTDRRISEVNLFPNPCDQMLFISGLGNENQSITIRDVSGRALKFQSTEPQSNAITLDVSNLLPGTYFIEIKSNGKRKSIKSFIRK